MVTADGTLASVDLDWIALKPTEVAIDRVSEFAADRVLIDYEGSAYVPDTAMLNTLATDKDIRLTTPVRADGFDPLGDKTVAERLPTSVKQVLVAGHSAYLTKAEQRRAIAPRLRAARERAPDAWIGTEGIERLALAAGGTQFELLSRTTESDLRALRAAGFDGELAVYAPVVLTDDEDTILDAIGAYVARRQPVVAALSEGTSGQAASHARVPERMVTDSTAAGHMREVLLNASNEFALVGSPEQVSARIRELRKVGIDTVVGYPARGSEIFLD